METLLKAGTASVLMGLVAFAVESAAGPVWLKVVAPAVAGGAAFVVLLWLLRVREVQKVWDMARVRARPWWNRTGGSG